MNIEIGHDHSVQYIHFLFCLEPRDDLGRQKMGADRNVGLKLVQETYKWNRVEAVERQSKFFVPAGDIKMVVEPAQNLGRLVDQVDVRLGLEVAKDVVGVPEHVQVLNLRGQSPNLQGLLDGVGCTKMARPCAGGKNKYTSQHQKPPAVMVTMKAGRQASQDPESAHLPHFSRVYCNVCRLSSGRREIGVNPVRSKP